jgi:hypothetical protein
MDSRDGRGQPEALTEMKPAEFDGRLGLPSRFRAATRGARDSGSLFRQPRRLRTRPRSHGAGNGRARRRDARRATSQR